MDKSASVVLLKAQYLEQHLSNAEKWCVMLIAYYRDAIESQCLSDLATSAFASMVQAQHRLKEAEVKLCAHRAFMATMALKMSPVV